MNDYQENQNTEHWEFFMIKPSGVGLLHDLSGCLLCKNSGTQETKIYALKDFEKCYTIYHSNLNSISISKNCPDCKGTGYIIPKEYEPYEIKKVGEMTEQMYILYNDKKIDGLQFDKYCRELEEHNLKQEDKVVVRVKQK